MPLIGSRTKANLGLAFQDAPLFAGTRRHPWDTPGYGDGTPQGGMLEDAPIMGGMIQRDPMMAPAPQGGDGQISPGRAALAAFLGGLGGGQNPALQMLMQRQQNTQEDDRYERRRQQALEDQKALYSYKAQNPDDEFTQTLVAAGIDPNSPAGKAMYLQRAQQIANPARYLPNGDGTFTVLGGNNPPMQTPTAPVGPLKPYGGPAAMSGGFR